MLPSRTRNVEAQLINLLALIVRRSDSRVIAVGRSAGSSCSVGAQPDDFGQAASAFRCPHPPQIAARCLRILPALLLFLRKLCPPLRRPLLNLFRPLRRGCFLLLRTLFQRRRSA